MKTLPMTRISVAALLLAATLPLPAQTTYYWTATGGGNWTTSTGAAWSTAKTPENGGGLYWGTDIANSLTDTTAGFSRDTFAVDAVTMTLAGTIEIYKIDNDRVATTISDGGSGLIRLGAGGISAAGAFLLNIATGVEVTADQSWSFGQNSGFSGVVSGSGNLAMNLNSKGLTWSNAANTYSGTITNISGRLYTPAAAPFALQYATLDTTGGPADGLGFSFGNATSTTIGGLQGSGLLLLSRRNNSTDGTDRGGLTLSIGNNNSNRTFSGNLSQGASASSIIKIGSGTQVFSGTNTYTGTTTVAAGTLQFAKQTALYNATVASWTAAKIVVADGGTLAFNVGGTGEFTTSNITTLLTNLAASSSATNGMNAGSSFGFDTSNAAGGVFTINDTIANSTGASGGARGLSKLGSGTLVLGGSNTYTGATTIVGGTLEVSGGAAITDTGAVVLSDTAGVVFSISASETIGSLQGGGASGGNVTIASGQSLTVAETGTNTFSGVIDGAGGFVMSGAGTIQLAGANTYSGGTTISAGTLRIGSGASSGSLNGTITAQGGGVLEFNRSDATTVSNTLAGNGTFRQIGGDTLTLSGTNTTNGTIAVTNGTILFSGADALPANGSLSASANATLSVADGTTRNSTLAGGLTMSDANFVFDINSTSSDYLAFTGAASLSGTNMVKLNLSNATSSTWTLMTAASGLDGGTWSLDTNSFTPGGMTWTLSSNATALTLTASVATNIYYWTGNTSASWGTADNWSSDSAGSTPRGVAPGAGNDIYFAATGASNLSTTLGQNFTVNSLLIADPGVTIGGGHTLTANETSAQAFNITADSGTTTLAANLAGAGAGLRKSGNGSLTLSGTNTYGDATTIVGGTVTISGGAAIADSGAVVLSDAAGVVFTIASSETIGSLQGGGVAGGNATIASGQTLTVAEAGTNTFSGVIGGAGNLVKSAAGTMVLAGANAYSGSTTISAGTLQIGNGGTGGSLDSTSGITNNAALVFNRSDTLTVASAISGSGAVLQLGGGTTVLAANSTYTGATTISAGTLQIGNGGTSGSIASTSGITNNATLAFNRSDSLSVSQAISGGGGVSQLGSGTLVLSGNNSYSGTTTLAAGTLQLESANAIGTTGAVTFTGGNLRFTANNTSDISSRISSSSSAIAIDTNGLDVTFASAVVDSNTAGLVKNGAGTLLLTANNSYTGSTVVNAGTLQIGNGGAAGTIQSTSITNYGKIIYNTSSVISLGGVVIAGTGEVVYNGSGTLDFATNGSYAGTGSVILNSGTLLLKAVNQIGAFASLDINGGELKILGSRGQRVKSVTMSAGTISLITTGSVTLTADDGFVFDGGSVIAGVALAGGSLTKNGAGTTSLLGANTYSGGTTLNSGTLVLGNATAAGSGTITQTDGTSLLKFDTTGTVANNLSIHNVASNQTLTLSGNITAQNTTYDVASGTTLSINGTISGSGGVTKIGDGMLELNAANTFTGATVVSTGTLKANAAGSLANTSNITVNGGSLLVTADNAIGDSVGINLAGGTLAFSGIVTDTIGALTLSANSVIDLGTGSVVAIFADLFMGNYTLAVHNWTGTTLWNGGTGNNTDQIYFNRALGSGELDRISFYSDFGSDFLGTGFQLGLGSGFQYEVIPVPEAETWVAAALLLAGAGVAWMRGRRRQQSNMDGQDQQDGACS